MKKAVCCMQPGPSSHPHQQQVLGTDNMTSSLATAKVATLDISNQSILGPRSSLSLLCSSGSGKIEGRLQNTESDSLDSAPNNINQTDAPKSQQLYLICHIQIYVTHTSAPSHPLNGLPIVDLSSMHFFIIFVETVLRINRILC